MRSDQALADLGVGPETLTAEERSQLDEAGYLLFPSILDETTLDELSARCEELENETRERLHALGEQEDPEIREALASLEKATTAEDDPSFSDEIWAQVKDVHRRAGGMYTGDGAVFVATIENRGAVFDRLWQEPRLLACLEHYLGDFRIGGIAERSALPHGAGRQIWHVDWTHEFADDYRFCNSVWMLSDFTVESGATRVVPGSHLWRTRPEDVMEDTKANHPEQVHIEGPAGSLAIFNGYIWHAGGANTSGALRRGIFVGGLQRDVPREAAVGELDPETRERLSPAATFVLDADARTAGAEPAL